MDLPWFFLGWCQLYPKLHWGKGHKTSLTYLSPHTYSWERNGLPIPGVKTETSFLLPSVLTPPKNTDNAGSLKIHSWDAQHFFSELKGFSVNNFCQPLRAIQSSAAADRSNYSSHVFCTSLSLNVSRITEQFLVKFQPDFLCYCYSDRGNHKNLSIFGLRQGIHSCCL